MNFFIKYVWSLLAVLLLMPAIQTLAATPTIKDVKDSYWASKTIHTYVQNGYITLQNGYFYPNASITRGEVATILMKTQHLSMDTSVELLAKDVQQGTEQYKAFQTLVALNIFTNSEYLKPNAYLTRAQMAKVIALTFQIEVDAINKKSFKDYSKTFWAKDYIESLADEQIIQGKSATRFAPNDYVTKAQFITLVSRAKSFQSRVQSLQCVYDLRSHGYISTIQGNHVQQQRVITLVNEQRVKVGLAPLQEDLRLSQLATIKVDDMMKRNYFEHESPYYGMVWEMANYFDYEFRSIGENLAKNLMTAESAVKGWMASPTHKANILKSTYTHIGISMKKDVKGNVYWVQFFSSK